VHNLGMVDREIWHAQNLAPTVCVPPACSFPT
jgi:hypothetical protein